MPNHIQNRLKIEAPEKLTKEIMDFMRSEEKSIDFNNIIPKPKDLDVESSSLGDMGYWKVTGQEIEKRFFSLGNAELEKRWSALDEKRQKECIDLGEKYVKNIKLYGFPTWYKWAPVHWGTKWNAYGNPDERDTENTIYFETAWAAVPMIIKKVSEKFPDAKIYYDYADEDTGYNTGKLFFHGEKFESNIPDGGSKEAYELAFDINPDSKDHYVIVDGKYEYVEEE